MGTPRQARHRLTSVHTVATASDWQRGAAVGARGIVSAPTDLVGGEVAERLALTEGFRELDRELESPRPQSDQAADARHTGNHQVLGIEIRWMCCRGLLLVGRHLSLSPILLRLLLNLSCMTQIVARVLDMVWRAHPVLLNESLATNPVAIPTCSISNTSLSGRNTLFCTVLHRFASMNMLRRAPERGTGRLTGCRNLPNCLGEPDCPAQRLISRFARPSSPMAGQNSVPSKQFGLG
jgi:hypothetical protein